MGTRNTVADTDAYRDLPFLLKPTPAVKPTGRSGPGLTSGKQGTRRAVAPPAPPSAGYNPYFDLSPDRAD